MKKLIGLLVLVPALGVALLSASHVFASGATVSGNLCVPVTGTFQYATVGIASGADGNIASCPIPLDDQALGSTVNFRTRVYDNSGSAGFSCVGYVYDRDGGFLAVTGTTKTTSAAFIGGQTFGVPGGTSWSATVPGTNVSSNVYTIQCTMPGNYSTLYTMRAY